MSASNVGQSASFEVCDVLTGAAIGVVEARSYAEALDRANWLESRGYLTNAAISVTPLGDERVRPAVPSFYEAFFQNQDKRR